MVDRLLFLILASAFLAACGPVPAPVVDMAGVDQGKYSHDLADCYDTMPAIAAGNPITKCMAGKGYKILVGY